MSTLVLVRHGQSTWNNENLFTGWHDVDLSKQGEDEARKAGQLLASEGIEPEVAHTSLQKRAIRTLNLALEELDRLWIPVRRHWRLNERHYGALQGLNKAETEQQYGREQFLLWRRSYATPPPALEWDDERHPRFDPRYADLDPSLLPATECLKDVLDRMLPYWYDVIVPDLRAGKVTIVSAHGNSLRALVKHLKGISDDDIPSLEIPTGVPWVFTLDADLRPTSDGYLGQG
jgi:2,3-bisphosphoglycerate-dependent phosphoglycerate mutase